jgi:hypothetical protein
MTDYVKLPPDFKAKWLEALRSGNYTQTTGMLRRRDGFCCLGVACDVNDPSGWGVSHGSMYYRMKSPSSGFIVSNDVPLEVWAALSQLNDSVSDSVQAVLAHMNDNGKTFTEIADWIEENL